MEKNQESPQNPPNTQKTTQEVDLGLPPDIFKMFGEAIEEVRKGVAAHQKEIGLKMNSSDIA